jgi:hypothetical protein
VNQEIGASGDGSLDHPVKTIAEGVGAAGDDESVIIKTGAYNELLTLSRPVTLKAASGSVILGP